MDSDPLATAESAGSCGVTPLSLPDTTPIAVHDALPQLRQDHSAGGHSPRAIRRSLHRLRLDR